VWSVVQIHSSRPLIIYAVIVILLTNDDGIEAEGLETLEKALRDLARIVVVAPDKERSAVSHGLTIHTRLEFKQIKSDHYALNGTPADCIIMALRETFVPTPDLVVSGINHGANLGDDIMYSGTVAAAREAARHGVPGIAISQVYDDKPIHFKKGAEYSRDLIAALLQSRLGGELCLNVNIPAHKIKGVRITRQGCSENVPHFSFLDSGIDYDNVPAGSGNSQKMEFISDRQAILNHFISITPLQRDQTDYSAAQSLLQEDGRLFSLK
jgi:5'-nucleotidase